MDCSSVRCSARGGGRRQSRRGQTTTQLGLVDRRGQMELPKAPTPWATTAQQDRRTGGVGTGPVPPGQVVELVLRVDDDGKHHPARLWGERRLWGGSWPPLGDHPSGGRVWDFCKSRPGSCSPEPLAGGGGMRDFRLAAMLHSKKLTFERETPQLGGGGEGLTTGLGSWNR